MLTTLPTSLDHTYARILDKIAPRRRRTVHAVLECIIAASRPLTVNEIQEIFLLELDTIPCQPPYLPISDHSDEAHSANIFKLLPGLFKIENGPRRRRYREEVHFIHFTVQEYLLSHISDPVPSALQSSGEALSASMLTYFRTSHEKANATLLLVSLSVFEAAVASKFPNLEEYAKRSWFIHAKSALPCYPSIAPAFAHFLNPESRSFNAWVKGRCGGGHIDNLDHPLHWAVHIGSVDEVRRLLNQAQRKGVRIGKLLDTIRWTPICYAACAGDIQVLSALVSDSWADAVGASTFKNLLEELGPDMAIVKLFLEKGADPETRSWSGACVAHAAAYSNASASMIRSLVDEHDIDVNVFDQFGRTPLHIAVHFWAGPECVRAFLDAGADPNLCDDFGLGPLDYAREELSPGLWGWDKSVKAQEIYNILEQRGAKLFMEISATNVDSVDDSERSNMI
ncbi:ankyrin [Clavulina sp. PMI_390]|nr:ankyrin [Clavulina sp. PMI_390]